MRRSCSARVPTTTCSSPQSSRTSSLRIASLASFACLPLRSLLQLSQGPRRRADEELVETRASIQDHRELEEALQGYVPGTLKPAVGRQGEAGALGDLLLSPAAVQAERLDPTGQHPCHVARGLEFYRQHIVSYPPATAVIDNILPLTRAIGQTRRRAPRPVFRKSSWVGVVGLDGLLQQAVEEQAP